MALIDDTPASERSQIMRQILITAQELKALVEHPERLNEAEKAEAFRLAKESQQVAIKAFLESDRLDLNDVIVLNIEIAEFVDAVKLRLNDPIETGPEAAAGYWQERAHRAEDALLAVERLINFTDDPTPQIVANIRTILRSYNNAKSRD
jgi:hypothetical protein